MIPMKSTSISVWLATLVCVAAAPIIWDLPANTTGKGDLIEGSVIAALNGGNTELAISDAGASGTASYVFAPSNYTTINFTPTGGDVGDAPRVGFGVNQYNPETIATTGDGSFDSLISTVTYSFGTPTGIATGEMLLEGLTIGTDYQIQVFFNEQRNTALPTTSDTRAMTYGDGLGNIVTIAGGDSAAGVQIDHYGQFAIGSFTADATSQVLTMDSSMGPNPFGNVHYNAILVTGPGDLNVPPQLDDASFDLEDAAPIDTLVATLVATDGNAGDNLSYTLTAGDPDGVFALDPATGELRTAGEIDVASVAFYSLTIEVSDGTATDTATIGINIFVPAGNAVITWEPAQNTSSVADLLAGTPVFARNGGDATVTIAGTSFESINLGGGFSTAYGAGGIFSTGDLDFDALISGFSFGGGAGTLDLPGNITGLTPGKRYSVQVFYNEQRPAQSGRVMTFGDGNGNSVDVGGGATLGTGEPDDYGQFAVGQFTAISSTQLLLLTPGGAGFGNSHLNAILVVEGGGVLGETKITSFSFDPLTRQASLTWTSNPGRVYSIVSSDDLANFDVLIDPSVSASADGETTTWVFVLPAELGDPGRFFFRVEPN